MNAAHLGLPYSFQFKWLVKRAAVENVDGTLWFQGLSESGSISQRLEAAFTPWVRSVGN
jgi:hypothetical protein